MFEDEFEIEDNFFDDRRDSKDEQPCPIMEKFLEVEEEFGKLDTFFNEIDGFVAKQIELFSTLNAKFPNISQFSIALNEAKETNANIEENRGFLTNGIDKLDDIKNAIKQRREDKIKTEEMVKTLLNLSLHADEVLKNEEFLEALNEAKARIEQ